LRTAALRSLKGLRSTSSRSNASGAVTSPHSSEWASDHHLDVRVCFTGARWFQPSQPGGIRMSTKASMGALA
jgi:hypothetical protein